MPTAYLVTQSKAKRKRTSKNAKQMRNKKRNCFLYSSASPETINSVSLNSVSRIKQTDVQPVLHLEVSCFGIAHTVNKTQSKHIIRGHLLSIKRNIDIGLCFAHVPMKTYFSNS